jgi:translation initiation factor IF-2
MSDNTTEPKKTLSLGGGTLSLKGAPGAAKSITSSGRGGGRTVAVEVRRKRGVVPATAQEIEDGTAADLSPISSELRSLTSGERESRMRALRQADEDSKRRQAEQALAAPAGSPQAEGPVLSDADLARQREIEELQRIETEENQRRKADEAKRQPAPLTPTAADPYRPAPGLAVLKGRKEGASADEEEEESYRARMKRNQVRTPRKPEDDGHKRKLTVTSVLNQDYDRDRGMSLAARRRAAQKARMMGNQQEQVKQSREVVVPETITVQELSNRMAEKASDLIKSLMKMGVMATINDPLDADTAEIIIGEFGHKIRRVTDADIEEGLEGHFDTEEELLPRPPVVTIMGHVDHGKTSLLDALRQTDVVSGEAGGITQHIGAYQVKMPGGQKITFLDTPGHAAFTEMRARGANVTDLVVLVVAANDSIMPQTIEAINHAKAAKVPILVAINKIDLPDANVQKVKQDLLQHEIILEELGGDTLSVEVSAKKKLNLDKLEETILLQAEVLNLRANPNRKAVGTVVEAKLEQGRGHVATVLIQKGTLKIGDIFVVGAEFGRVRAMVDDHGVSITKAIPGQPIEVLGLNGAPDAGDHLIVVEDEARARNVAEYRQRKRREAESVKRAGGKTFEQKLAQAKIGAKKELGILVKADVHGSVEAIIGSLKKLEDDNDEIAVRILHSGVGGITESDVTLANASGALIVGFNVRANAQARELAEREGVDLRYYNIIYNVIDDAKAIMSGMLSPIVREEYLGQANIRQVFNITKVGKVAGCMVTKGTVKRGAKVRLLRDDVVIHEGTLKTLKRFKDEVKDVKEGMECGMAFENYDDVKDGDIIECYEIVTEARTMA